MFNEYETTSDGTGFKSRRGTTAHQSEDYQEKAKEEYQRDYDKGRKHWKAQSLADDIQEERWLRRYRYQHLRSKSEVPMSVQNYDRHGIENL